MKHRVKIFPLALGSAGLLSLILLFAPWSLFSQNSSSPSPDFDGNGVVGIPDFLLFVSAFGTQEGQEEYESKYDLDSNGEIGIPDFLLFVENFGKEVKRLPPTCMPTSGHLHAKVTLSDRAGQYQLTLVEVVNGTDARSAQGTLTLRQQPPGLESLGSAATPLYGFTNVISAQLVLMRSAPLPVKTHRHRAFSYSKATAMAHAAYCCAWVQTPIDETTCSSTALTQCWKCTK